MDNADNLSNAVEDYNGFLVKVLSGSKDSKDILQKSKADGMNLTKAIENYMANVSDTAELERLRELLGAEMPDNTLQQMLWRNANPSDGSTVWKAKDAMKQRDLLTGFVSGWKTYIQITERMRLSSYSL